MNRDGHNDVTFFIGPEVEHTPAFAKKTLFVVGRQDLARITEIAEEHKVPHIFLGANHSFDVSELSDLELDVWNKIITSLLDKGYWVTLDYQAHQHAVVRNSLNEGIWQSRLFVPLLSVRIPRIEQSGHNLTVKFDDIDFDSTNPGVWCMHHHEVMDSNRFTDWSEYTTDEVLALTAPVDEAESKTVPVVAPATPVVEPVLSPEPVVKNDPELGLDTESASSLKPEPTEVAASNQPVVNEADAAAAYAEGTTADPLSAEESKKTTTKKAKA